MTVWNWFVLGLSLALGAGSGGPEVVHITHAIPPWLENEDLSELRWVIRGDTLNGEAWARSYPCSAGGLEPVAFRDRHGRWTTCHADFSAPDSLQFVWNTCCGGFNVTSPDLRNRRLEVKLVQSDQWQERQGTMLRCGDTVFHAHETDPVYDWVRKCHDQQPAVCGDILGRSLERWGGGVLRMLCGGGQFALFLWIV